MRESENNDSPKAAANRSLFLAALVLYTIGLIVFVTVSGWKFNLAVLLAHVLILRLTGFGIKKIFKPIFRLFPFFLMMLAASAFFGGNDFIFSLKIFGWEIGLSSGGISLGAGAIFGFLAIITVSNFYEFAIFKNALEKLAVRAPLLAPLLLVRKYLHATDLPRKSHETTETVLRIQQGLNLKKRLDKTLEEIKWFSRDENIKLSERVAFISGISFLLLSTKMVKALPGIPFASGQRLIFTIPLLFYAAKSAGRFAATWTALTYGLLTFFLGQHGNLGVLEFARLMLLGFTIDILWGIISLSRGWRLFSLTIAGAFVGFLFAFFGIFFATLLSVPNIIYLFAAPRFVSNTIFGALSGSISYYLLADGEEPEKSHESR